MNILSGENKTEGRSQIKNKIVDGEHKIENMDENAGKYVDEMDSKLVKMAEDKMKSGQETVKKNPIKSMVIGAATGFISGSLLAILICDRKD